MAGRKGKECGEPLASSVVVRTERWYEETAAVSFVIARKEGLVEVKRMDKGTHSGIAAVAQMRRVGNKGRLVRLAGAVDFAAVGLVACHDECSPLVLQQEMD